MRTERGNVAMEWISEALHAEDGPRDPNAGDIVAA